MTRAEMLDKLRRILVEHFEIDGARVGEESRLVDDLGLDSIDGIDISARLRPWTGRKMTDEEIRSLRTVGDVVDTWARIRGEGRP